MGNDSCRLIAINLFSFVDNPFTKEAKFDFKKLYEVSYEAQRLMDDLVDLELVQIDKILNKIDSDPEPDHIKQTEIETWSTLHKSGREGRRTGLGITALADVLAALNLPYDSEGALKLVDDLMLMKTAGEWDSSIDMAIERGSFKQWDSSIDDESDFIQMLKKDLPAIYERNNSFGRRNISISTVAPTGSLSILAQTSSGIEPVFQTHYTRRKKINPSDSNTRVDFVDDLGDSWQHFNVLHPKLNTWNDATSSNDISEMDKETLDNYLEISPYAGSTAPQIDWMQRVKMQSVIQKYITHSISSTINLPSDIPVGEVSNIYMESWKQGLKGITVYRDGSRSGVLVTDEGSSPNTFTYQDAAKRPKDLDADLYHVTAKGVRWTVLVGLLNDKPYEVFAFPGELGSHKGKGYFISKAKKNVYELWQEDKRVTENIISELPEEGALITRMLSTSLRHGADIQFVVEQLNKADGEVTSFAKAIARTLKPYIPEGKLRMLCSNCSSTNVKLEEGCSTCLDCGSSACS